MSATKLDGPDVGPLVDPLVDPSIGPDVAPLLGPQIVLSSKSLTRPLGIVMALVVTAGVGVELLKEPLHLDSHSGVLPVFSLSYEWNIPTLYSAALLWTCALVLALVAASVRQAKKRFLGHWSLLAIGFAYIGVDEILEIHEKADGWFGLKHIVYFDWIAPAAVLLLGLGALFVPFLRALPRRSRNRFLLAGVLYVGGAVGMEIPLGWWTSRHGSDNLAYALIDAVEESLEMFGLNYFLLSLIDHLATNVVSLHFAFEPSTALERSTSNAVEPESKSAEVAVFATEDAQ